MSDLSVELLTSCKSVRRYQQRWNELAGDNPLLSWEWLGAWCEQIGRDYRLMVLVIRDGEQVIGITPWYIRQELLQGRTICFMGDGKVCTDHLTLLCEPGREKAVATTVAEFLMQEQDSDSQAGWDHIELIGVDSDDLAVSEFTSAMSENGCHIDQSNGVDCYGITLPDTMEEYIGRRSKSGKREMRKLAKILKDERVEIKQIESADELQHTWFDFVDLHNRRRAESKETGCFRYPGFGEFLWEASAKLMDAGKLRLTFAFVDGIPMAAQHAIATQNRWFYYQSGMDSNYGEFKPGQLILMHTIQQCINDGVRYYDLMRGDESYKLRWRAEPVAQIEVRIAKPQLTAVLRQKAWRLRKDLKRWSKRTLSGSNS